MHGAAAWEQARYSLHSAYLSQIIQMLINTLTALMMQLLLITNDTITLHSFSELEFLALSMLMKLCIL